MLIIEVRVKVAKVYLVLTVHLRMLLQQKIGVKRW